MTLRVLTAGVALSASWLSFAADRGNGAEALSPTQIHLLERGKGPEHQQARLDALGKRLNIGAGQQDAWAAYRNAALALRGQRPPAPATDASAATLVRARADFALAQAQKLSQFADATDQLERVLDAEQQKTLNEAMHRRAPRMGIDPGDRGVDKAPTT
jgi:hypothetical protein